MSLKNTVFSRVNISCQDNYLNNMAAASKKSILFFRRISVMYVFFITLIILLGLFYFKYIPDNKEELNNRGHRVLLNLSNNILEKDKNFQDIFQALKNPLSPETPIAAEAKNLEPIITFQINKYSPPKGDRLFPFFNDQGNWRIFYRTDNAISVSLDSLMDNILAARQDIFDSYLLLLDTITLANPAKHDLIICYAKKEDHLSNSPVLNADTLISQQKNSDLSGIANINISGIANKVFFSPFTFRNHRFLLAGLIAADEYKQKITEAPLAFFPGCVIAIIIILFILPFLKIFLLSPGESINRRDVFNTALSFYLGAAAICLIVAYLFLEYISSYTFNHRLNDIGRKLYADITQEFQQAEKQIDWYDHLPLNRKERLLLTKPANLEDTNSLNKKLTPTFYKNLKGVFWINETGNTIAIWNAFTTPTKLTPRKDFTFFKILRDNAPEWETSQGSSKIIIYPDQSNITNEFLVYMARPSTGLTHFVSKTDTAKYIAIGAIMHCSMQPVIPEGFGFCMIDNRGKILIDAQSDRNLSQNIIEESGDDPTLENVITYKNTDLYFDLQLYGEPYTARAFPIKGHPITLLVYYGKKNLSRYVVRMLLFCIESLLLMFIAFMVCLLTTRTSTLLPSRLLFKLRSTEWVRPSLVNEPAYAFNIVYFSFLTFSNIMFFLYTILTNPNLDNLFWMSFLLPFYTLWSISLSREKQEQDRRILLQPGTSRSQSLLSMLSKSLGPLLFIVFFDFFMCRAAKEIGTTTDTSLILSFQILLTCFLILICTWHPFSFGKAGDWLFRQKNKYRKSLMLSIFLIGLLPACGIIVYTFYGEKIQYKKNKLLTLAKDFRERSNDLVTDLKPSYKEPVLQVLQQINSGPCSSPTYFDSLIYFKSIYLSDHDTITKMDGWNTKGASMPDNLYVKLVDNLDLHPRVSGGKIVTNERAGDNSWSFKLLSDSFIRLSTDTTTISHESIGVQSALHNPVHDLGRLPLKVILFMTALGIILLVGAIILIRSVVDRLFLLTYISYGEVAVNSQFLNDFFVNNYPNPSLLKDFSFPTTINTSFFLKEANFYDWTDRPACSQEDFILAMAESFSEIYQAIWDRLNQEEKYILFDFAVDRYTNYKNTKELLRLMNKGIINPESSSGIFSLSFRNFVLAKKDTQEIFDLKQMFGSAGAWQSIRIPILSIVTVIIIIIAFTQTDFSKTVLGILTSVATIFPLILKVFEKKTSDT